MYQSLHTTVLSKKGIPFEIQIRTWEMHRTAEYGIAAHWKYKLGKGGKDEIDSSLQWIHKMLENGDSADNAEDMVSSIKGDLSVDEIYVFTPKGDVKSLPKGSTVIDFAYAIHSAVGNKMTGAKVDGRIVPLDTTLKTGQVVEVITSNQPGKGPSRDWLGIVKTGEARSKIRSWFKKEKRDENIVHGKSVLEHEFKRNYLRFEGDKYLAFVQKIAEHKRAKHTEGIGKDIGRIERRELQEVHDEFRQQQLGEDRDGIFAIDRQKLKPRLRARGVLDEKIPNGRDEHRQQEHHHAQHAKIRPHERRKVEVVRFLHKVKKVRRQDHRRGRVVHEHKDVPLHHAGGRGVGALGVAHLREGVPPLPLPHHRLGDALLTHGDGAYVDLTELLPQLVEQPAVDLIFKVAEHDVGARAVGYLVPLKRELRVADAALALETVDDGSSTPRAGNCFASMSAQAS